VVKNYVNGREKTNRVIMNTLTGNITHIETSEELSLVKIAVGETVFTSIVIDTPETLNYLKVGNDITLYFKETEVIIAKTENLEISIQNRIPCTISNINEGKILTEITLKFKQNTIHSIITTNACKQLNLQVNGAVLALVKTNEISIAAK